MSIQDHLEPNDFVVIIRPMREAYTEVDPNLPLDTEPDGQPRWTGEVQVAIVADSSNSELRTEEFEGMIQLSNLAAASIAAMEENQFIHEIIQSYAQTHMITPMSESLEKFTNNVLSFSTITKGNA